VALRHVSDVEFFFAPTRLPLEVLVALANVIDEVLLLFLANQFFEDLLVLPPLLEKLL